MKLNTKTERRLAKKDTERSLQDNVIAIYKDKSYLEMEC